MHRGGGGGQTCTIAPPTINKIAGTVAQHRLPVTLPVKKCRCRWTKNLPVPVPVEQKSAGAVPCRCTVRSLPSLRVLCAAGWVGAVLGGYHTTLIRSGQWLGAVRIGLHPAKTAGCSPRRAAPSQSGWVGAARMKINFSKHHKCQFGTSRYY